MSVVDAIESSMAVASIVAVGSEIDERRGSGVGCCPAGTQSTILISSCIEASFDSGGSGVGICVGGFV